MYVILFSVNATWYDFYMKKRKSSKSAAFIISIITGIGLCGLLYIVARSESIPVHMYGRLLVFGGIICTAFITVLIYQSLILNEKAEEIATSLTQGMFQYPPELFSDVYTQSQFPYMIIDTEGYIESVNYAMARFMHVEVTALIGLDAFHFLGGEHADVVALIPQYFAQGKYVNEVEVQVTRPDGMVRFAVLSLFIFKDRKGARKGLLSLLDVTQQKLVDKAKTEFVSLASHQLRTPISGMKWNLELFLSAEGAPLGSLQLSYIEKIRAGLVRMELLVGDFLSAARFELGTLTPQYTVFNLQKFIETVRDEHQLTAERKRITLTLNFEGDNLTDVRSDAHLLHMITSNLLDNALKYTPEQGSVQIVCTRDTTGFRYAVRDTGIGIPAEEQEMIFSKMYRAQNARTEVAEGTGLGLYIVQEAAHILGGSVSFVSAVGHGSTFTLTLPPTLFHV